MQLSDCNSSADPLIGKKYNNWTILDISITGNLKRGDKPKKAIYVVAICDCGNKKRVNLSNIKTGASKSCGCIGKAKTVSRSTKHGYAKRNNWRKEHKIWCKLFRRCYDPKDNAYNRYGAKGIIVADRWHIFNNFIEDMGDIPAGKDSIDRYPNKTGNYEPGNCRWADDFEQSRNRTNNVIVPVNGINMTAREAERVLGLPKDRLQSRLKRGYSLEDALTLNAHTYRKKYVNMDFKIVTVATHKPNEWYFTFDEFFKSCGNYNPLVLDTNFSPYSGLGSKIKMVYKAIKEGLIDTKYILFCDCFDTFFAQDPSELIYKFRLHFDFEVMFSAERNCYPDDLKDDYDKLYSGNSSFKYLNSGMIVGETAAFYKLLQAMNIDHIPEDYQNPDGSWTHINDQFLYQQIFLKQPVRIGLDYNQKLCQNLHQTTIDDFDFSGVKIINKETKATPILFHANGNAKDSGVKEPILKHLGL